MDWRKGSLEREINIKPQTWVRELIDPSHTLPNVEILPPSNHNRREILFNGNNIGCLYLGQHPNGNTYLESIIVNSHGIKGCGLASYISVIEETLNLGKTFQSDKVVTKDAVKIWTTLATKGIAMIVVPFTEIESVDGDKTYSGDYRINPR